MTHEQRKTNSEDTTKKHEEGNKMALTKQDVQKKNKEENFCVTQFSCQNSRFKSSAFVPLRCNTNVDPLSNGLFDNFETRGQKRKLQLLKSENLDSDLTFNDVTEKRFKAKEPESIYDRKRLLNKLNEPFYDGEKLIYYNPSFMQNTYSTLSGLNGFLQDDVSRKLTFNFDAFSNDISKLSATGLNSNNSALEILEKEMKTSEEQTNTAVEFRNDSIRVGEINSRLDECNDESHSKNTHAASVENKTKTYEEKFLGNSQEFISLDSTKSSFLTMIKKLREDPENDVIPCPFCSKTFAKYSDLKIHVHTHKYGNTCSNGIRTDERSLYKDQSTPGNAMSTPVSTPAIHSPCTASHGPSSAEDCSTRVTSVIQFAEKKTKNCPKDTKIINS